MFINNHKKKPFVEKFKPRVMTSKNVKSFLEIMMLI